MVWRQGEHLAIIGQTGSGKTFLARKILQYRKYTLMLATKADDLNWVGWRKVRDVSKIDMNKGTRWRLEPHFENQWEQFVVAAMMAWNEGCWTVYLDEEYYVEHELGLGKSVIKLLTQGRSKRISVVVGMQRPSWVTRFALSEPRHIISFGLGDRRDLKTLTEGVSEAFAQEVAGLGQYEFAYYNKATRELATGRAQDLDRIFGGKEVK